MVQQYLITIRSKRDSEPPESRLAFLTQEEAMRIHSLLSEHLNGADDIEAFDLVNLDELQRVHPADVQRWIEFTCA